MSNIFVGRGLSFGNITDGRSYIIPAGLIVPYNDTTAPGGWELYTAADGKYLIGAGDTYAVDDNAAAEAAPSFTDSTSRGSHSGTGFISNIGGGAGANVSAGSHTDSFTPTDTLDPGYQQFRLIKASSDRPVLPSGAQLLTHSEDWSGIGLTESYGNSRLLKANTTIAGADADTSIASSSTGTASHSHGSTYGSTGGDGSGCYYYNSAGAHSHTMAMTMAYKMKAYALSAWSKASGGVILQTKTIALYESVTPPTGWYLCDGNNGTPDLRDYFINIVPNASHGSANGYTNTIEASGTSTSAGAHSHLGSYVGSCGGGGNVQHSDSVGAHTHELSSESQSWMPAYYALAFIMYGG